jgi:hypothetical protein
VLTPGKAACRRLPPGWTRVRKLDLASERKEQIANMPGVAEAGE